MARTDPQHQADRFDRVYRDDDQTYGAEPSQELIRYVDPRLRTCRDSQHTRRKT